MCVVACRSQVTVRKYRYSRCHNVDTFWIVQVMMAIKQKQKTKTKEEEVFFLTLWINVISGTQTSSNYTDRWCYRTWANISNVFHYL